MTTELYNEFKGVEMNTHNKKYRTLVRSIEGLSSSYLKDEFV
jgi:hypothetical protein